MGHILFRLHSSDCSVDKVTNQLSIWHIFQMCSYAKLLLRTGKQKSVFPGGRLTKRVPVSGTDLLWKVGILVLISMGPRLDLCDPKTCQFGKI